MVLALTVDAVAQSLARPTADFSAQRARLLFQQTFFVCLALALRKKIPRKARRQPGIPLLLPRTLALVRARHGRRFIACSASAEMLVE